MSFPRPKRKRSTAIWKVGRAVYGRLKLARRRWAWYVRNAHNETSMANLFTIDHVSVGRYSYGKLQVVDGDGGARLRIGDFCSIADGVVFVLNGEHRTTSLLTFPLRQFVLGGDEPAHTRGDIVVADDVWIGHGATILSGVTLGRGCIVAAGSVVTKNVGSFETVAGVPARPIGSRFDAATRTSLCALDYSSLTVEFVQAQIETLEQPMTPDILGRLIRLLNAKRGAG